MENIDFQWCSTVLEDFSLWKSWLMTLWWFIRTSPYIPIFHGSCSKKIIFSIVGTIFMVRFLGLPTVRKVVLGDWIHGAQDIRVVSIVRYPQDGFWWKIPGTLRWWLGVPPFIEPPKYVCWQVIPPWRIMHCSYRLAARSARGTDR